jgi:hypothetical protein
VCVVIYMWVCDFIECDLSKLLLQAQRYGCHFLDPKKITSLIVHFVRVFCSKKKMGCYLVTGLLFVIEINYLAASYGLQVDVRHGFGIDTLKDLLHNGEANK